MDEKSWSRAYCRKKSRIVVFLAFFAGFSIFRQNAISKRLNIVFESRIDLKEENWLFLQIFTKICKNKYYGDLFVHFSEKSNFRFFGRKLLFKRLQRLESACNHFFGGGLKMLCLCSYQAKNLKIWPKNDKVMAFQSFELQKTT